MADCNCQGFCWCKLCFYSNHLGSIYNPSKIYIQFTIFNIYFSTKLLFTKQEISLACARKVSVRATRSQIYYIFLAVYSSPFSSFTWQCNKLCFYVVYHCMGEILWSHIFKQLLFLFILLPFVHLPAPKKNMAFAIKQRLFI